MSARILVVDDIPANVRLLEVKLTAEYFEVLTALDGPSALEIAERQSPDLILTDIMMPGMDGFEVCQRLKQNPATAHIPVVMVTALSDVSDRVHGLEVGADDFLTKPANDVALFARVRSLARLKQMMDELRLRQAATSTDQVLGKELEEITGTGARVLLAEHSERNAERLTSYLVEDGQSVLTVRTIAEAMAATSDEDFDLMSVNLHLGQEDGLRLCSQLRSQNATRHTPILLILDEDELPHLAKGLDLGVTDYLIKPVDRNELHARCRTQVRRRRYHDRLRRMLRTSVSMAYTDPLTGVYNRRYMNANLERRIMEIAETMKSVSILMLDIDHFKSVNDTYGHPAGDAILKQMVGHAGACLRDTDMIARYGGEEFVVIMPDADPTVAARVGERLRATVAAAQYEIPGQEQATQITVSVGCASTNDPMETSELILGRADAALYQAKHAGRNRVVSAEIGPIADQVSTAAG